MDWTDLRCFVAVAEAGSLTLGARATRFSVATMTRRLDHLEQSLELKLLVRSASGTSLTLEGERILTLAKAGADQFDQIERVVASLKKAHWSEAVRISATEPMITDVLAPALPKLWAQHPNMRVDLRVSTQLVSLDRRDADIALRLARPEGNSLMAKQLPDIAMACFATRAYLAGRDPRSIDLRNERLMTFDDSYGEIPELAWIKRADLESCVAMRTGSTNGLLNAVRAGAGIALFPVELARRQGLVRVASPPHLSRSCWIVFHRDLRKVSTIQRVRTWLADAYCQLFA